MLVIVKPEFLLGSVQMDSMGRVAVLVEEAHVHPDHVREVDAESLPGRRICSDFGASMLVFSKYCNFQSAHSGRIDY
jgi:hypothetical protein